MKIKFWTLIVLTWALVACNNNPSEADANSDVNDKSYVDDGDLDVLIATIDVELGELTMVKSLMYLHDDESTASTIAYLDKDEKIVKIEEVLFDSKMNSFVYQDFYYKSGVQFASRLRKAKTLGQNHYFSEVISFYDEKGNVTASKERAAQFEEYLSAEGYKKVENEKHSSDNAYAILQQKGKYATTFKGFVTAGQYDFLIVGGPEDADYTSSLSIQEDSPTLRYLRKEGKNALGQQLRVEFERFTDPQGYEMQILRDLAIVKEQ